METCSIWYQVDTACYLQLKQPGTTWHILAATAAAVFAKDGPATLVAGVPPSYMSQPQGRLVNNCSCHTQPDRRGQQHQAPQDTT
jgi:hypothetical protein